MYFEILCHWPGNGDRSPGSDTVKRHSPERFHTVWRVFEVCPAICLECGHVPEKDSDTLEGWCGSCDSDTMVSALVLAGIF